MKSAAIVIGALSQEDITQIEKSGIYNLSIEGENYELTLEDFDISADEIPGWQVATDGDITVALDLTITDDLKSEGVARELVNRIQNIRKQSEFEVTDRIMVRLTGHKLVEDAIASYGDYIKAEVLADNLSIDDDIEGEDVDLIDGVTIKLRVAR